MDNEKAMKLIKEFEGAAKATEEMLTSMDGFKDVLRQYYRSHREIIELKDKIVENGVVGRISDAATELSAMNKQIADNISMVNNSIDHIQLSNSEELDRIVHINLELKSVLGVFDQIRGTVKMIENLNEAVEKSIISEFDSKFEKMCGAFSNIERVVQAFDSSLNGRLDAIEKTIKRNYGQIEEHIEQSGRVLDQTWMAIGEASRTYDNSNERLISEIQNMVETSAQLRVVMESINAGNQDGIEAFTILADEWASKSIHGMAIKKKNK